MDDEPIDPGEFVLRKFHKNNYKKQPPPPVLPNAFEPREWDTDGISLYRERYYPNLDRLIAHGRSPGQSYIVRLSVQDILALGLTVEPTEGDGDLPGHVSIRQLTFANFQADYTTSRNLQTQLAMLASFPGAIVYRPSES